MTVCKLKKWGNSLGLVIPKDDVKKMNLHEDQSIDIEIKKIENTLKELFGAFKDNPITREEFLKHRKSLESKYL